MSYWPRFKLTPFEAKFLTKYSSPDDNRRGVLRRFYPGKLELNENTRLPTYDFNIARKSRVFGLSMSGDLSNFRITLGDATGEQYLIGPIEPALLITGPLYNNLSPDFTQIAPTFIPGFSTNIHIFEPNISLAPNQTLTIQGFETEPYGFTNPAPGEYSNANYRIDFTLHVWEFPGMPGSPL
jgi:hypothetical protein